MKKWNDYKQTYRAESDIFDFARTGDLRGFANLLQTGSDLDLNATNQKGYSALMLAVYNGEKDFCEALLRSGANVHSRDCIGNTVLMGSAYKGDLSIFKLLLQFDANMTDKNKTNMTAGDWATMFGRKEIVKYLDTTFPDSPNKVENKSSQFKNILRFLKLTFIMLNQQLKAKMQSTNR